jgi:hypothetical protein
MSTHDDPEAPTWPVALSAAAIVNVAMTSWLFPIAARADMKIEEYFIDTISTYPVIYDTNEILMPESISFAHRRSEIIS